MRRAATLVGMTAALLLGADGAWAGGDTNLGGFVDDGTPVAHVGITTNDERDGKAQKATPAAKKENAPVYTGPPGCPLRVMSCYGPKRPGNQADPVQLATRAVRRLPLSGPEVATSPPPDRDQLVNLPTWLWVRDGWAPRSATASVPGVSVTVTATPESVTWDMGNGERVVCNGPGTPYNPSVRDEAQSTDCSYTYHWSSAGQPSGRYQGTATMTWRVTWRANGAAGGGDLGPVSRSTPFSLRVAEGQAVMTAPR
jgi:hypothetical protein